MYTVTITDQVSSDQVVHQMEYIVQEPQETPPIIQTDDNLVSSSATRNQRFDDNGTIEGGNGQIYAPGETGNYWTIVSNSSGSESEPSNIIFFQPTNIEELVGGGKVNVYPNSAGKSVTLDYIATDKQEVNIHSFNAYGKSHVNLLATDKDVSI